MATIVTKLFLAVMYVLIWSNGFTQTGFYLTYPCKEGNADITRLDRSRKNVCITAHPIVTVSELHSVSHPIQIGNETFFDIQLTRRGFDKLEQVYPITDIIVFVVRERAVFLMDTEKHRLAGTIRVHILARKDIAGVHGVLASEIARSKEP